MSCYRTIVADPPWEVDRSHGGAGWAKGERVRPMLDYPTLTVDEIAALPVRQLGTPDAHLYVWTVQRHLEATFAIVRNWGFWGDESLGTATMEAAS